MLTKDTAQPDGSDVEIKKTDDTTTGNEPDVNPDDDPNFDWKARAKTLERLLNKKPADAPKGDDQPSAKRTPALDEPVTRKEIYLQNEREAVKLVTEFKDEDDDAMTQARKEISENLNEIMDYYEPRSGKLSPRAIAEDLLDAHAAWHSRMVREGKISSDLDRRAVARLMSSTGSKGKGQVLTEPTKKPIIPRNRGGMETWFQKKDK